MKQVKVYGTKWCPDCARAKQVLSRHNVPFTWVDIENDEKALE